MSLIVTCQTCGDKVEGLLDYENHARAHEFGEARQQLTYARARSREIHERITRANAKYPVCITCGMRHSGAAWTPGAGWHDHKEGN